MRWFMVDKFLEVKKGTRARAVKCVSLSEDHLHDHFPGYPVMPPTLMIESMAQTGGLLAGYSQDFKKNVILAKVPRMRFLAEARPGDRIELEARLADLREEGSTVEVSASVGGNRIAEGEILFAHLDGKTAGSAETDFVFTQELLSVLNIK